MDRVLQSMTAFSVRETSHPRLHILGADLASLRNRANREQARYADELVQWVDLHAEWEPRLDYPFADGRTGEVELEECGIFVTNAALAYLLSGDARHLELAKRWALQLCQMPQGAADNYGFGPYIAGLARAYDWLYDEFSPGEQAQLRVHIARVVRLLYLGSFTTHSERQWWAECQLHHDHWIATGGYGEAALAIVGEVAGAETWALRAAEEFATAFSWLGDDGAWPEGPADWVYALTPLLWFYGAWQSVTGEDKHEVPWLRNTIWYRLYHWLPDNTYIYTNDSFRSGRYNTSGSASCHVLRRLASLFNNEYAQWLATKDEAVDLGGAESVAPEAAYEGSSYEQKWRTYAHPEAPCLAWNVLWYDPDVAETSPEGLPTARHFENQGVAVLRSDWSKEATTLSFSCGPLTGHRSAERVQAGEERIPSNYYHAHADYNAFTLFAQGKYFIVPPGYARRDSRFQNSVSVNGANLRADARCQPRIFAFGGNDSIHYVAGDGSEAFAANLHVRRFHRHLLMLPPDWVVICDDVRILDQGWRAWNRLEWTVHSDPTESVREVMTREVRWRGIDSAGAEDGSELRMRVFSPDRFIWEQARMSSVAGAGLLEPLRISVPEWYRSDMQVLSLWECTSDSISGELAAEQLAADGCLALAVDRQGDRGQTERWVVVFASDGGIRADQPLLRYEWSGAHKLFLCGIGAEREYVDVRWNEQFVELWPDGRVRVQDGGWLQVDVE